MEIIFTAPAEMRNHLGELEYQAAPGQVLDLPVDQAMRWLKRNMAQRYVAPAAQAVAAPEPESAPLAGQAEPAPVDGAGKAKKRADK